MLEVKPIQTKEEQKEICGLCGVEFDPDYLAYGAKENQKLLGVSQFRILGNHAVIYDLSNAIGIDDIESLIIMGKAALNVIDLCGVKDVVMTCRNEEYQSLEIYDNNLPTLLGFKRTDGEYKLNLEGYFTSPCSSQ